MKIGEAIQLMVDGKKLALPVWIENSLRDEKSEFKEDKNMPRYIRYDSNWGIVVDDRGNPYQMYTDAIMPWEIYDEPLLNKKEAALIKKLTDSFKYTKDYLTISVDCEYLYISFHGALIRLKLDDLTSKMQFSGLVKGHEYTMAELDI
jgi:hypothetical protein